MSFLEENERNAVRERLREMKYPVKLVHFTQELNLEYGREARMLLEDLAEISPKLSVEIHNFLLEKENAAECGVDKVPATLICNGKDYGIRYYGLPAGYEFAALLDAILSVSGADSELSLETRRKLTQIIQPVHLEVFVTPT